MKNQLRRYFRIKRNRALSAKIEDLHRLTGTKVRVLDVGGSPFFWETVSSIDLAEVVLLNLEESKSRPAFKDSPLRSAFRFDIGDGCEMPYAENDFDLVVCNSVIEHVGDYGRMKQLVSEIERVGKHGWVQTPAYEFPIEPHFGLPLVHWLGQPTRAWALRLLKRRKYRGKGPMEMREVVEGVNLLSKGELLPLFRTANYRKELFLFLTKSHIIEF